MSGCKAGLFNVREHLERVAKAVAVYHANGDTEEFKNLMARIGIVNDRILRKHDITRSSGDRSDVYVNRVNGYGERGAVEMPLALDLFCGLGGWTEGLLIEGYDVVGFDIEQHVYGEHRYPAQLVLQDVLTLHGSQFKDAALIVASPPCQAYSYRAMPWKKAKALPPPDNSLFEACFRIQREACEAAGRHIPLIVENVRGAQKWVGRARWNYGSFYLWGDVPALMPSTLRAQKFNPDGTGSWFAIADSKERGASSKGPGFRFDGSGRSFQSASVDVAGHEGVKQHGSGREWWDKALDERRKEATGIKNAGHLNKRDGHTHTRPSHGNSSSRKFASAMIAKIPLPLSRYIAATFKPRYVGERIDAVR